jgi:tRNA threonylcarbamoyladenosine biosynthesis protein TsaB
MMNHKTSVKNPSIQTARHRSGPQPRSILLAIDTSTRYIGLALFDGSQVLAEIIWNSTDHHTVELAPAVQDMLLRVHVTIQSIQAIGVAIGPGSFTGLRIGLAFAKGIALVQHIPLIGIPSLDILAAAQPPFRLPMAAALRAGRGRLAVGWYLPLPETDQKAPLNAGEKLPLEENFLEPTTEPPSEVITDEIYSDYWHSTGIVEILTPQELLQKILLPTLICGEFTSEERKLLRRKWRKSILAPPAACLRRPAILAELAWRRWKASEMDDKVTLSPIYLHYQKATAG